MTRIFLAMTALSALAGCAMNYAPTVEAPPAPGAAMCEAEPVKTYVGQRATAENGAAILAQSGARTLRWGPPRSAWTMDYRQDRVNVRYDEDMVITEITCG
jgi:hypothetical protein